MRFISTRNENAQVSAAQAIVQGLSEEGGLFVPESFPEVDLKKLCTFSSYDELAAYILQLYLTEYSAEFLQKTTKAVYKKAFANKAAHMCPITENIFSLELWHGPTGAFKDYALQLMPHLLAEGKRIEHRDELTYILVATSGDTGKAALSGYQDVPGVKITAFYPQNGTSEVQRLQMTAQEGQNVSVFAVDGNFDDAQSGVKKVFANKTIEAELLKKNIRLSSANSINWGRLVPQIVYYFAAYKYLLEQKSIQLGDPVDFCVPTGNFGDILAGYYAKCMGLPVRRLVCASNQNNVLTDFLQTGLYDARRTFYRTISPSMDILISSNLERLLYHVSGDAKKVTAWMDQLSENGFYQLDQETLAKIQQVFAAGWADDEKAGKQLRECFQVNHYLCDPHTAVAFSVAKEYMQKEKEHCAMVVLSTATPFKFSKDVLRALNRDVPENEFEAMEKLSEYTGAQIPENLYQLKNAAEHFTQTIQPAQIEDIVRNAE